MVKEAPCHADCHPRCPAPDVAAVWELGHLQILAVGGADGSANLMCDFKSLPVAGFPNVRYLREPLDLGHNTSWARR